MAGKTGLGVDVLTAARARISRVFDDFEKICVSFSGGKDSTVMMHLVMAEAIKRNRKIGCLIVDLEAQYKLTIEHIGHIVDEYAENIDLYWVALPIILRNAVSQYEQRWCCWDEKSRAAWVRDPDKRSITDHSYFSFFRHGMEFEEFVPAFGRWYSEGRLTASFVGIRSDESLNRYRAVKNKKKQTYNGNMWTTYNGGAEFSVYPIYDWKTDDIWTYLGKYKKSYNHLYDLMHRAGLSIHQQRICQPYGDDQRKGLWLYHIIEPETWGKVVARVSGANSGALYSQESGNINGVGKISKPDGITWRQFADRLLNSMPSATKNHYENKISVFLKWWDARGFQSGIPDDGDVSDKNKPCWRRICKTLLRNDYWCKGLSFSQTNSAAYKKYQALMTRRRAEWGIF